MTDARHGVDPLTLVRAFPNPALLVGPDGSIRDANNAALALFGYGRDELIGARVEVLVPDSVRARHVELRAGRDDVFARPMGTGRELPGRHRSGAVISLEIALQPIDLRGERHVVVSCIDIGPRRAAAELLDHLAHTDALTGLPTESVVRDVIAEELAANRDRAFAVLYLDLDGFKAVNDAHGHAAGDEVLLAVARRLVGAIREADVAARLHGDEFAIVLRAPVGLGEAIAVADRVIAAIKAPIGVNGESSTVEIGASIGLALGGAAGLPDIVDGILQAADEAVLEAKRTGRGRLVLWATPEDQIGGIRGFRLVEPDRTPDTNA